MVPAKFKLVKIPDSRAAVLCQIPETQAKVEVKSPPFAQPRPPPPLNIDLCTTIGICAPSD